MSLKEKYVDKNQDIIQSCRKNNRKAQVAIYQLYYKAMYNTSLRITNNPADAEDIMQESFLEAFRRIDSYNGDGSFGAWLKRIVINKSLDFVKARQSRMSLGQKIMEREEQKQDVESEAADTDAKLLEVKSAMGKLPDNYRIILALFLIEGYDHQEIAQILKTPYGNVRTRYSRAKQRLIEEITKARNNSH
jgi:RNA polymerase sigma-70 factor (ECF subfamily)